MRDTLTAILKRDYRALAVGSAEAALPVLRNEPVDLLRIETEHRVDYAVYRLEAKP